MISLLYTGLKLNSSIQIKLINFEVFPSDRKKKTGFPGFIRAQMYFVCFLKLVSRALQECGERDRYPAVSLDGEHYKDCEQLFMRVGKGFTTEALGRFFNMANKDGDPTNNRPPLFHILMMGNNKQVYFD